MSNSYFQFKQLTIHQNRCAMKVTTDSCFFGAWASAEIQNSSRFGRNKIQNLLDIGTGTGLLSLMIAQKNNTCIDAVEIDKNAAEQAGENVLPTPWKEQIKIFNENILSFSSPVKYDCIICNPPFYENDLPSFQHQKNIAHHSGKLTIEETIISIKKFLKEDGIFFLMYPSKREKELENIFVQQRFFPEKKIYLKQSLHHQPFRILIKGMKKFVLQKTSTISIWNENQEYTQQFVELLRDYYLYL